MRRWVENENQPWSLYDRRTEPGLSLNTRVVVESAKLNAPANNNNTERSSIRWFLVPRPEIVLSLLSRQVWFHNDRVEFHTRPTEGGFGSAGESGKSADTQRLFVTPYDK